MIIKKTCNNTAKIFIFIYTNLKTYEQNITLHILNEFGDDEVTQTKIMAILLTCTFRFPAFPMQIFSDNKQLLFLNALTSSHKTWS